MAGETVITVVGNLVDDPELRFTPSGAAVANFRIASTPRTFDRQTNEWKDGDALFLSCSVWRQAAENVAESLQQGHARRRAGPPEAARQYETREGEKRTVFEIEVDEVGPSLKFATAKVTRASALGRWRRLLRRRPAGRRPVRSSPAGNDPWATPAPPAGRRRRLGGRRRRPTTRGAHPASARTSLRSDPPPRGRGSRRAARRARADTLESDTSPSPTIPASSRASRKEAPQWPRQ